MSDPLITDHNENSTHNSKAETRVNSVAKANLGSNTSHLAEPLSQSSTADVHMKEEEKKESDSETGEETDEEEVEEEEVEKEVEIIDKIRGKEEEVEEVGGRKGAIRTGAPGGQRIAATGR